ncbi:uncharacterized protein LOC126319993 [Schistocerca gregaria]|uniref:uncharacterized protein LOC126319993 n=1 Tax=Schistocerca gregaria TaxID=7010 RepID=UPI00211E21AF|nr:uncharacterized protein LOC126319993 [Schistocerca gregaria]
MQSRPNDKKRAKSSRWPKVRVDLSKLFQKRGGDADEDDHEGYDEVLWEPSERRGEAPLEAGPVSRRKLARSSGRQGVGGRSDAPLPQSREASGSSGEETRADRGKSQSKSSDVDFGYYSNDDERDLDYLPSAGLSPRDEPAVESKLAVKRRHREVRRRGSLQERARFLYTHKLHLGMLVSHTSSEMSSLGRDQLSRAVLLSLLPQERLEEWVARCEEDAPQSLKGVVLDVLDWISTVYERPAHSVTKEWKLLQLRQLVLYMSAIRPHAFTNKAESIKRDYEALMVFLRERHPTAFERRAADADQVSQFFRLIGLDLDSVFPNQPISRLDFSALPSRLKVNSFTYVETFLLVMRILGVFGRMVWTMDPVLVPSKFVPSYSFVNSLFFHQFPRPSPLSPGSASSREEAPPPAADDRPTLWAEVYHSPSEQWIPVDVLRGLVDVPSFPSMESPRAADNEDPLSSDVPTRPSVLTRAGRKAGGSVAAAAAHCSRHFPPTGHTFGFDWLGRVAQLSLIYSRNHAETLKRISDPPWLELFLQKWNQRQKERLTRDAHFAPPADLWDKLESIDRLLSEKVIRDEPPPRFIQAYRAHPLYCLERYRKKHEVFRPEAKAVCHIDGEPVFHRDDLCLLKTSNNWHQEGMQVKKDEQPIMVQPKRIFRTPKPPDDGHVEMNHYYAPWQVEPLEPETASNGKIPLNAYGNVYLFKPNMLPKGTVHLVGYSNVKHVSKKLGLDCAPAMIGWLNQLPNLYGWVVCQDSARTLANACLADLQQKLTRTRSRRRESNHTHVFPNNLYLHDETSGTITRTCPCGFKDTLRQLSMINDDDHRPSPPAPG